MELKELEYVLAIVEEGSISKAADRLYMAQSSLSQFLTRYEAELDVKLFMRTSGGVRLTRSGEIFAANARLMLRQYHRMKGELSDIKELISGRIEFGISSVWGSFLLPKVLPAFHSQYPGIDVVIHEYDSYRLREMLAAGDLDMALTVSDSAPEHLVTPLMTDEVCIAVPRNHPLLEQVRQGKDGTPWVPFSQAAEYEFLLTKPQTVLGKTAARLFAECEKHPIAKNKELTAFVATGLARAGMGLCLAYRSSGQDGEGLTFLRIGEKGESVKLALEYPVGDYRSRAVRALDKLIHANLAEGQ